MFNAGYIEDFERYINQLIGEISSYKNEQNIWKIEGDIKNSGGNLALHIIGNLNQYIGVTIDHTSYVRNRDLEFSDKNVPRKDLIAGLQNASSVVKETLSKLTDTDLLSPYPVEVQGKKDRQIFSVLNFLLAHLNYHLGQVNYHRRLLDK